MRCARSCRRLVDPRPLRLLLLLLGCCYGYCIAATPTAFVPPFATSTTSTMSASESAAAAAVCSRQPSGADGSKRCLPCEGGLPAVSPERLQEGLAALPLWVGSEDGTKISRSFVAKNFVAALDFLNAVGAVAEKEGHHPDLHLTGYRNVEIVLFTHSIGGITENDLIMAEEIDKLPVAYSPKWLKQHPAAEGTAKK